MTLVTNNEFATQQEKYFDLALNSKVFIKNGKNIFHILPADVVPINDGIEEKSGKFLKKRGLLGVLEGKIHCNDSVFNLN